MDADAFVLLLPFVDVAIVIDPDDAIVAMAGFAVAMAAIAVKLGRREEDGDP